MSSWEAEEIKSWNEMHDLLRARKARAGPFRSCEEMKDRLWYLKMIGGDRLWDHAQKEWAHLWFRIKECRSK